LPIWIANASFNGDSVKVGYKRGDLNDLDPYLARTVKPEDYLRAALDIIEVVAAIERMHEEGLVHGDIGPSNIFKLNDGTRFLDFEYSHIDDHDYSQPVPLGRAMRHSDPSINPHKPRKREHDLYSLGCVMNDLFPAPFSGNEDLREFLANAYQKIDSMDALEVNTGVAAMSEIVKVNRGEFLKGVEDPKEAKNLLFWLVPLMDPITGIVDFERDDHSMYRSQMYHLVQSLIAYGEMQSLSETLKLEPVKRIQELGIRLMESKPEERMTAEQVHAELRVVRKDLEFALA